MNIIKHFFTIGFSSFINILISLLSTPIITRIVDPGDYGKFMVTNSYVGIVASFCYVGLNDALLRYFYNYGTNEEKKSLLKLCFIVPMCISIAVSLVIFFLNEIGILFISMPTTVCVLFCFSIMFSVWNYISTEMIQNIQNSKAYSLAITVQKFVYCLSSILLISIFKKSYYQILMFATMLSIFASAIVGTVSTKEYWLFKNVGFPKDKEKIIKYAIPASVYFVIYSLYDVISTLLVDKYCSDYDVGIFTSAFSLVGIFVIVQTAFSVMWRPIQTEHFTKNPNDKSFISKGNRYISMLMLFVGINVIMFKDVLCLFLGEKYRIGSQIIPFLMFNPIMNTMISTVTSGIEKSNKSVYKAIAVFASLIIMCVINVILIPKIGAKGAAIAIAIALIVEYYLMIYFSNIDYYIDYGVNKSLTVIIVLLIFAYMATFSDFNPLFLIMYFVCLGVLIIMYKKDVKDIWNLLAKNLKR